MADAAGSDSALASPGSPAGTSGTPAPPGTPGKRPPAQRFEVYLVDLDPALGSEMSKVRPCVVVSPDALNDQLQTLIVAPMTTTRIRHPTRVPVWFEGQKGDVVLHQVRTVDQSRLGKRLGTLDAPSAARVLEVLRGMFA